MNTYKHYSFDLWMTLIRSNPAFKAERTDYFYSRYNRYHKTKDEIALIFRQIDIMCNAINEKTGQNIDSEEMYLMVISHINDHDYPLQDIDLAYLYGQMEQLVFKYPPVPYAPDTVPVLKRLKDIDGCTMSLLSNTAFIKGSTLRSVLKTLDMDGYFHFQLYSDELGMSKPNEKLFREMLHRIKTLRNGEELALPQIVHIGDNSKADIYGADQVGISSILINSNEETILTLLRHAD